MSLEFLGRRRGASSHTAWRRPRPATMPRRHRLSRARLCFVFVLLLCLARVDARSSAGRRGASSGRSTAARRFGGSNRGVSTTRGAAATRARGVSSARQAGVRSSARAAARAAARGVGAGVSFDRRARAASASSRPAFTRGGLGASQNARAAERPARPAERSASQFGAGVRYEAHRPQSVPAAATADTAPRAAASLGARARPGLAAPAHEKKAPRDVRETARPEAVSADLLASSFDANAADTTSASPRVDVRRCDGRAGETERADAESAFSLKKAPTTAARVGASRATKPAVRVGDARVTSQEKVTFRERDATAIGADSATVPPTDGTDGVAADLAVATNGASSDADVPGDVPGDVEEPIAVVPDAPSTSSLADAYVADVTATDQPVVPASRPPADTADAAATEVSAAAAGASGARDRIDLGTGAGAGMGTGTGTEAGTSSPTTPSTTTPDETVAIPAPQEGFQEETSSSFSPPSDGSDASAKEEAFSDRPTARPAVPSSANANADVAAGTAAPAMGQCAQEGQPHLGTTAPGASRRDPPLPPDPNVRVRPRTVSRAATRVRVGLRISAADATSVGRTRRAGFAGGASRASPSAAKRAPGSVSARRRRRRRGGLKTPTGGTSSGSAKT